MFDDSEVEFFPSRTIGAAIDAIADATEDGDRTREPTIDLDMRHIIFIFDDVAAQFGDVGVPCFFVVVRDVDISSMHKAFEFRQTRCIRSRIKFAMVSNF